MICGGSHFQLSWGHMQLKGQHAFENIFRDGLVYSFRRIMGSLLYIPPQHSHLQAFTIFAEL